MFDFFVAFLYEIRTILISDTPMDFGTKICNNLENGDKYMDSEDVFKDVQYIWHNCCKYNNKGAEGSEVEDGALSSQGKMQIKASQSKMKNKKHGRHHKSNCLCAICVLKRRKREREANAQMAKGQSGVQDLHPYGEDSSLNMDESVDADADAEVESEGTKVKIEVLEQQYSHMEEMHEEEEDEEENEIKTINKDECERQEQ
ncbi:hypothetical protein REPUB_Repub04eG0012100 [Reevesia pubescens]